MNSYVRYKRNNPMLNPTNFAETLVKNEKKDLEFRIGTHYADAT